ncbi:hypothetical protein BJF82_13655 [Kytococcus sp. CUA-901]|nr:hypothetical protein BJF82_13655 [Kytococcus sp. CUA-901]
MVEEKLARAIYRYLLKNDYINDDDTLSESYKQARDEGTLASTSDANLKPVIDFVWPLVDALYLDLPEPGDSRKPKVIPLNKNFEKKEFTELWSRINHRAVYQVEFDSDELIGKCVTALDAQLKVSALQYVIEHGQQKDALEADELGTGEGFDKGQHRTEFESLSSGSQVKYDLLGEITEKTQLTRRTVTKVLTTIKPTTFAKFRQNPEHFITECARLINEQKATVIVEHLSYDALDDRHDTDIFTANQTKQDFTKAGDKLKKHIYDYVVTDSGTERSFVEDLDTSDEVVVYAKLPRGFFIPTPVATTTLTGPSPSRRARSSTSSSSLRPRARCRLCNCARSKNRRSSAPGSSSTR